MTNHDTFSLAGQTAILTGAAGFLGQAFSRRLSRAGATLVVVDQDHERCVQWANALTDETGNRAFGIGVNVADEAAVATFAVRVAAEGIKPDVLINSAALISANFFEPLERFPLADWNQVMGVNVTGMFLMCRAFVPGMIERGGGVVINVGSLYGERGPDPRIYEGSFHPLHGKPINTPLVYSASKGAVSAMSRYLAAVFGDRGIRANTLVPGGVFNRQNDTFVGKYANRVPMGRMGRPEEIADALLFLASPASSYVNGQEIIVDGGVCAW